MRNVHGHQSESSRFERELWKRARRLVATCIFACSVLGWPAASMAGFTATPSDAWNVIFAPDLTSEEIKRYYREPSSFIHNDRCYVAWDHIAIMSNGDVLPNGACINYKLGNVKEASIKEIWNGQRYTHFRNILERDGSFPVCPRCCGIFSRPKEQTEPEVSGLS